jgi:hypothetical protein
MDVDDEQLDYVLAHVHRLEEAHRTIIRVLEPYWQAANRRLQSERLPVKDALDIAREALGKDAL